MIATERS